MADRFPFVENKSIIILNKTAISECYDIHHDGGGTETGKGLFHLRCRAFGRMAVVGDIRAIWSHSNPTLLTQKVFLFRARWLPQEGRWAIQNFHKA